MKKTRQKLPRTIRSENIKAFFHFMLALKKNNPEAFYHVKRDDLKAFAVWIVSKTEVPVHRMNNRQVMDYLRTEYDKFIISKNK